MFKKILEYVKDEKLRIMVLKDQVDIMNYKEILNFDDNKIVVDCRELIVVIKGSNLVINKLLDNEVLILGEISSIELG